MKWAIYYSDGSRFASDDGEPWDAPRLDVQVIIELLPNNEYLVTTGHDYFYFEELAGGFSGTDLEGRNDHLQRCRLPCPLWGRMMSNEDFRKALADAKEHWFSIHPECRN